MMFVPFYKLLVSVNIFLRFIHLCLLIYLLSTLSLIYLFIYYFFFFMWIWIIPTFCYYKQYCLQKGYKKIPLCLLNKFHKVPPEYTKKVKLLGHRLTHFNFIMYCKIATQNDCSNLYSQQQCKKILISIYSHQHYALSNLLIFVNVF